MRESKRIGWLLPVLALLGGLAACTPAPSPPAAPPTAATLQPPAGETLSEWLEAWAARSGEALPPERPLDLLLARTPSGEAAWLQAGGDALLLGLLPDGGNPRLWVGAFPLQKEDGRFRPRWEGGAGQVLALVERDGLLLGYPPGGGGSPVFLAAGAGAWWRDGQGRWERVRAPREAVPVAVRLGPEGRALGESPLEPEGPESPPLYRALFPPEGASPPALVAGAPADALAPATAVLLNPAAPAEEQQAQLESLYASHTLLYDGERNLTFVLPKGFFEDLRIDPQTADPTLLGAVLGQTPWGTLVESENFDRLTSGCVKDKGRMIP